MTETVYDRYLSALDLLCRTYSTAKKVPFGTSYIGRDIPAITLGCGSHRLLYVGGITSGLRTTALLLRFIWDYCRAQEEDRRIFGIDVSYLFHTRTLTVVPLLNPDGAVLREEGEDPKNPLTDRLLSMHGTDRESAFAHWETNGRGVDLRYNYDADFDICMRRAVCIGSSGYPGMRPESEPECAAVCRYLRAKTPTDLCLMLSEGHRDTDRTGVIAFADGKTGGDHRTRSIAQILSRDIEGKSFETDGTPCPGSAKDWWRTYAASPLFEVHCPAEWSAQDSRGMADALLSVSEDTLPSIPGQTLTHASLTLQYAKLRKLFFHAAVL